MAENSSSRSRAERGAAGAAGRDKGLFFICCVLMTLLLGFLIPSAIVNASPGEFVELTAFRSPLRYVFSSVLLAAGTFLVWCMIFYRISSGAVILSAAAVVDYMFFGTGYGNLSSLLKYDTPLSLLPSDCLLNLGIILVLSGSIVFLWRKKPEILKAACIAGCIGLAAMTVVNVNGIRAAS